MIISISAQIDIRVLDPPPAPVVLAVSFDRESTMGSPQGHIRLSAAGPDVTSRVATVVLNGGAPITVDMIDPAAVFACASGDSGVVTVVDSNAAGPSDPSAPFSFTVPSPSVPPAPTVLGVDFTFDGP